MLPHREVGALLIKLGEEILRGREVTLTKEESNKIKMFLPLHPDEPKPIVATLESIEVPTSMGTFTFPMEAVLDLFRRPGVVERVKIIRWAFELGLPEAKMLYDVMMAEGVFEKLQPYYEQRMKETKAIGHSDKLIGGTTAPKPPISEDEQLQHDHDIGTADIDRGS